MTELRGKHLYIDCFAGLAGDMFLGAAIDLGLPEEELRQGLAALPVPGYQLQLRRAARMGIEGCDVKVLLDQAKHQHHSHDHGHRAWREIREMIAGSELAPGVIQRALEIFGRVARAEAALHGKALDEVHFHEVGAVDSIVDIVGAALALEYLAPARVTSRRVPLGHGYTRCAHGRLPVPSPAALKILEGCQVEDGGAEMELTTPTGAAIVASCADAFGPMPAAAVVASGYGAGDGELDDRPNHLRLVLLEPEPLDEAEQDAVVIEANIDNMAHEWCEHLMERLFAAGARDVWYTPIMMKKGRPAITVSMLCAASRAQDVGATLLAESTTIGMRSYRVGRRTLSRQVVQLQTAYGAVEMKLALDGQRVVNAAPEYRTCKAAADQRGVPLKEVYAAAVAAYRQGQGADHG